jgi:hypothetical protein
LTTANPVVADNRNFYKVELWTRIDPERAGLALTSRRPGASPRRACGCGS